MINVCGEGDGLTVLTIFLYPPCNLDGTRLVDGIQRQVLDNAFLLVVEDVVVRDEGLDDLMTRWMSVVINLILGGLGVFAQTRTDVTAEHHDVKEKVVYRIIAVACLCSAV